MKTKVCAKVNLGLNVVNKRADGYHDLETVFYPVALFDSIEINEAERFAFHIEGEPIAGDPEKNLVVRAYRMIASKYSLPQVDIILSKQIPMQAGMGGGSADCAFTIRLLNEQFNLGMSVSEMQDCAVRLGADCPFFIQNKPVYATGIGNIFSKIDFSLNDIFMVLVKPDVHISTKEAYSLIKPQKTAVPVCERIKQPIEKWKDTIVNDFEYSVFPQHPSVKAIKDKLYENGAIYASMSGSGSSVYGFFSQPTDLKHLFPSEYVFQGGI